MAVPCPSVPGRSARHIPVHQHSTLRVLCSSWLYQGPMALRPLWLPGFLLAMRYIQYVLYCTYMTLYVDQRP